MLKTASFDDFEKALSNLNKEQRLAVDTIEGPVMVVAGPGTGKTQILTLRIANILRQTDTKPEQILALTFTESGVRAMRERLARFIGAEAYQVPIHTFHSFAGELIKRYPDSYEKIVGGRPASDLEKIALIEQLLDNGSFKRLRPHGNPAYYVKSILGAIGTLKKEYISPDKFAAAISKSLARLEEIPQFHEKGAHKGKVRGEYLEAQKKIEKNQELLFIYRLYEVALKDKGWFDFEDMILDTIEALESNQEMLLDVQEQYLYILADEHQDVNQSQNRLIELIASYHDNPNVFVVGDEKQAIYRFQGASLDNFLYFDDIYPKVKTIALTTNYRSDQRVLDIAHAGIKTDDPLLKNLRVPLIAHHKYDVELTKRHFSHTGYELAWVVSAVAGYLQSGVKPSEIAIIVKTNLEVEQFALALRKSGIVVAASADSDILEHPLWNHIFNVLKVLASSTSEEALLELLHAPYWGLSASDLVHILASRSYGESLLELLSNTEKLQAEKIVNIEVASKITNLILDCRAKNLISTPAETLEYFMVKSGFLDYLLKEDPLGGARVVRRIYEEVEGMYLRQEANTCAEVVRQFELYKEHNLALNAPYWPTSSEAVSVMTAHKSKGLEFEVVFIPHLTDSSWGGNRRAEAFDLPITKHEIEDEKTMAEDDEKRLFYVSLTRAKRVVNCTYSAMNESGREFAPSRFLVAMSPEALMDCPVADFEKLLSPIAGFSVVAKPKIETDFLRAALEQRGWSATTYNNYCKSPWEFIYKNALRAPNVKSPEQRYGTAVHSVLEKAARFIQTTGARPTDTEVRDWLKNSLAQNPLSDNDFTRYFERGLNAVLTYLPTLENEVLSGSKTEYNIKAVLQTGDPDFPEVKLNGNFDRIDFDESGLVIRVIDYKTGKSKTRGEIEGTTKTSDGAYKRQLIFYALLLSLQTDERLWSKNGRLAFVEADQKGVIRVVDFTISEAEIEDLKQGIIAATKAVVSGECLSAVCDPDKTDYCHLVDSLKL